MVCWVLDWLNIWALKAALLWQMNVLHFEFSTWLFHVNKYLKRLFWRQQQSCTERGRYFYKSVRQFQSVPSKEVIQKFLCDPQNEHVEVLCSQYLGKCTDSVTVLVRTFIVTHCGRVTQICVFTLQLCKTDDANLRF